MVKGLNSFMFTFLFYYVFKRLCCFFCLFTGIVWLLAAIVGSPMWQVQQLEVGCFQWHFQFSLDLAGSY